MILKDDIFPVGQIGKPHGLKGELTFTSNSMVLHEADVPFVVLEPDGIFVPFYIESVRMKTGTSGLIKLERIDTEEQARPLVGQTMYLPNRYLGAMADDEFETAYFVGFDVEEQQQGYIGKIKAVNDSTMNALFIVAHESGEVLIPVADEFIVDIDHERRLIRLVLPEGLLAL